MMLDNLRCVSEQSHKLYYANAFSLHFPLLSKTALLSLSEAVKSGHTRTPGDGGVEGGCPQDVDVARTRSCASAGGKESICGLEMWTCGERGGGDH